MKLWHGILLTLGILLIIGGSVPLIFPSLILPWKILDNPQYAPGEATAMVERVYHLSSSDLYEEYLGQGIWEVKSLSTYYEYYYPIREPTMPHGENGFFEFEKAKREPPEAERRQAIALGQAIFRVYETTNTVQPYNNVARIVIKKMEIK